jgi:ribosome maturation factor RimP
VSNKTLALQSVIQPFVEGLGFEWIGLEYLPQGKHSVLRLFVDKPSGVTVDECSEISRRVSDLLDVEMESSAAYYLEVSSPGIDRRLFTLSQCAAYLGKKLRVKTHLPIVDKREFVGTLESIEGDALHLSCNDKKGKEEKIALPFKEVYRVNVEVDWKRLLSET